MTFEKVDYVPVAKGEFLKGEKLTLRFRGPWLDLDIL